MNIVAPTFTTARLRVYRIDVVRSDDVTPDRHSDEYRATFVAIFDNGSRHVQVDWPGVVATCSVWIGRPGHPLVDRYLDFVEVNKLFRRKRVATELLEGVRTHLGELNLGGAISGAGEALVEHLKQRRRVTS